MGYGWVSRLLAAMYRITGCTAASLVRDLHVLFYYVHWWSSIFIYFRYWPFTSLVAGDWLTLSQHERICTHSFSLPIQSGSRNSPFIHERMVFATRISFPLPFQRVQTSLIPIFWRKFRSFFVRGDHCGLFMTQSISYTSLAECNYSEKPDGVCTSLNMFVFSLKWVLLDPLIKTKTHIFSNHMGTT